MQPTSPELLLDWVERALEWSAWRSGRSLAAVEPLAVDGVGILAAAEGSGSLWLADAAFVARVAQ